MFFLPLGSMVDGYRQAEKDNQTAFDNDLLNDRKLQKQDEYFIQAPANEARLQLEADTTLGSVDYLNGQLPALSRASSNSVMGAAASRSLKGQYQQQRAKYMIPQLANVAQNEADTTLATSSNKQLKASEVVPRQLVNQANQIDSNGRLIPLREQNTRVGLQQSVRTTPMQGDYQRDQIVSNASLLPSQTQARQGELNSIISMQPGQMQNDLLKQYYEREQLPARNAATVSGLGYTTANNNRGTQQVEFQQTVDPIRNKATQQNVEMQGAFNSFRQLLTVQPGNDPVFDMQNATNATMELRNQGMIGQNQSIDYLPEAGWVVKSSVNGEDNYTPVDSLIGRVNSIVNPAPQQKVTAAQQKAMVDKQSKFVSEPAYDDDDNLIMNPDGTIKYVTTQATSYGQPYQPVSPPIPTSQQSAGSVDIMGTKTKNVEPTGKVKPASRVNMEWLLKDKGTQKRAKANALAENPKAKGVKLRKLIDKHARILVGM